MDEAVLRRQIGGREIMQAQLQKLIEASALPNVNLVMPDTKEPHGPVQLYTASQWTRFVTAVRTGEFDL
jgi:hypothetical protein